MDRAYHRRDPMNAGMDEDLGRRMDDDIRRLVVEHGRVPSDGHAWLKAGRPPDGSRADRVGSTA
jgi:hypothetical protein